MKQKIYKALSLRGGASKGLKYFRVLKEIHKKNIFFANISGSSAGGIFAACLACIRDPQTIYELFLSLRGDRIMKWSCEAETGKKGNENLNILQRITRIAGVALFRRVPILSIKRRFKKHLQWSKTANTKLYIGVVKQRDVLKVVGKEVFTEFKTNGIHDFLDRDGTDDIKLSSYQLIKHLPMYFFSNDGVYKKEYKKNPYKVSNHVEPLWKIVLATFANPLLPTVRLRFNKRIREKCFDGGIANSHANTIWPEKDFVQISCLPIPKKLTGKEMGLDGITSIYYNENPAKKAFAIQSKVKNKGFFGFYDANIEEYYKEGPTKFF